MTIQAGVEKTERDLFAVRRWFRDPRRDVQLPRRHGGDVVTAPMIRG
jgi:hypothetical protein